MRISTCASRSMCKHNNTLADADFNISLTFNFNIVIYILKKYLFLLQICFK